MGGSHSRNKGHGFERDIANRLKNLFPEACRQLEYQEGLGVDLANTGVMRIQCKAYKKYAPLAKIEEAGDSGIPALITKGDRKPILIALRLDDFLAIIENPQVIHGETNEREES